MKYFFLEKDENSSDGFINKIICGVDEAGRGNLAGPMVVCACVLKKPIPQVLIDKVDDSKKTSKKQRAEMVDLIKEHSVYEYVVVDVAKINEIGPKQASIYGMRKCCLSLKEKCLKQGIKIDEYWTDAEKLGLEQQGFYNKAIIHGDALSLSIASASIIAKYEKDRLMDEFCDANPQYDVFDFRNNAGYGTKKHLEALNKYGKILDFHRLKYRPVLECKKIFIQPETKTIKK